jgi:threonine dehydratase
MVAQQPDLQTVLVPIGGGGLAAGIARAMKQLRPSVRIVGVQAEASAAIYHSLKAGRQITIPDRPSLADGIQGNVEDGSITFELIRDFVDEVVTVTEDAIRESLLDLLHQEKILAEGAAAVTVAAFRAGLGSMTEPTVAVISGGNLDLDKVLG